MAAHIVLAAPSRADCAPEPQGEGRVAAIVDSRTLRLDDGRSVRLAGMAALRGESALHAETALTRIAAGRTVSLHGEDFKPDRYGRHHAWVFAADAEVSLQETLVAGGLGVRDSGIADPDCRGALELAENKARAARLGLWGAPNAIKNAERPDDISAEIGHFMFVGGRVRSVREAGGWTYLNFGRRWVDGFAAMVPKGAVAAFEKAGQPMKGFEGQPVLVRGYVTARRGPRIEVNAPDQIEAIGEKAVATARTRD